MVNETDKVISILTFQYKIYLNVIKPFESSIYSFSFYFLKYLYVLIWNLEVSLVRNVVFPYSNSWLTMDRWIDVVCICMNILYMFHWISEIKLRSLNKWFPFPSWRRNFSNPPSKWYSWLTQSGETEHSKKTSFCKRAEKNLAATPIDIIYGMKSNGNFACW